MLPSLDSRRYYSMWEPQVIAQCFTLTFFSNGIIAPKLSLIYSHQICMTYFLPRISKGDVLQMFCCWSCSSLQLLSTTANCLSSIYTHIYIYIYIWIGFKMQFITLRQSWIISSFTLAFFFYSIDISVSHDPSDVNLICFVVQTARVYTIQLVLSND